MLMLILAGLAGVGLLLYFKRDTVKEFVVGVVKRGSKDVRVVKAPGASGMISA